MGNQQHLQEDEVDLREYINVMVKRKKLILSVFLAAVVISAVVTLLLPKVYSATSIIQIGNIKVPLIGKEEAKEIILSQNSLISLIKELNLKIEIDSLKKNIILNDVKNSDLLIIRVVYPGLDRALKINETIINSLIARGQSIYQERIILINERLKEVNAEIKNIEEDIDKVQNMIYRHSNSSNSVQPDMSLSSIILQNTLSNYENNLTALRDRRSELKLLLASAKDFKVFDQPVKSKKPIWPKKRLIVFITGMIGLMSGIFLAFFLEFWQEGKEQRAKV